MNKRTVVLSALFVPALLMAGCSTFSGGSGGEEGVRLMKIDPPQDCRSLGSVRASAEPGDHAGAKRKLRAMTAEKGGNYVRWEGIDEGFVYVGTAFICGE